MSGRPRFRIGLYLLAVLGGVGVGLALYLALGLGGPPQATRFRPPKTTGKALIGGAFELVDQNGKTRRDTDFRGRHMLVFFGYTHCPDFCPTGLQAMADALDKLGADAAKVVPIFVTIDPERDTPKVLKGYAENFHARLVALSGTSAAVAKAAKAYRIYYAKSRTKGGKDYLMDHSTFTYLMGPDGNYVTHFAHGLEPAKMAERIRGHLRDAENKAKK